MLCLIIGIVSPNGSNEASHHMFSLRYKKNYPHTPSNTPSYLELCSYLDKSKTCIFAQFGLLYHCQTLRMYIMLVFLLGDKEDWFCN